MQVLGVLDEVKIVVLELKTLFRSDQILSLKKLVAIRKCSSIYLYEIDAR